LAAGGDPFDDERVVARPQVTRPPHAAGADVAEGDVRGDALGRGQELGGQRAQGRVLKGLGRLVPRRHPHGGDAGRPGGGGQRAVVTLSVTLAMWGRCSEIWIPLTLVSIGLKSPRIPSGASGLRSHMSIVDGPPPSQTMMTEWAFLPRPL